MVPNIWLYLRILAPKPVYYSAATTPGITMVVALVVSWLVGLPAKSTMNYHPNSRSGEHHQLLPLTNHHYTVYHQRNTTSVENHFLDQSFG